MFPLMYSKCHHEHMLIFDKQTHCASNCNCYISHGHNYQIGMLWQCRQCLIGGHKGVALCYLSDYASWDGSILYWHVTTHWQFSFALPMHNYVFSSGWECGKECNHLFGRFLHIFLTRAFQVMSLFVSLESILALLKFVN